MHYKTIKKGLYPYAIALNTIPLIAIAPLLIVWFGTGILSKIIASVIICFFPILVNTVRGLNNFDKETIDLFRSYSATKSQIFTKLRLPASLPYLFTGLKIATGLSVVGSLVGEFIGGNKGLGYIILVSSYRLETINMFGAIMLSTLMGIIFFLIISFIEKRVIFWNQLEEPDMEDTK